MTVNELYSLAKTLMFEKPSSTIYDNYVIGNVNRLIAELYSENNLCRMFYNKKPLESVPYVETLDDELAFEDEYQRDVMPKGLCAYFLIDDDLQKYGIYSTDYNNARVMHQKVVSLERMQLLEEAN